VSAESRFLELLPTIDSLTSALCRRRGLAVADAEDFAADVRARFVESDYAPIRQFRGESSVTTYLAVVISSWMRDYIVARDGRWRPSAAAMRAGPVAVHLERLVSRDGRTRDQAVAEVLAASDQPYSERELRAMLGALPHREAMRPRRDDGVHEDDVPTAPAMLADALVDSGERDLERARAARALESAVRMLDAEDRVLVAMRFLEGHSVADIARTLRLEQKPLYRRLERSLTRLRRHLESAGITGDTVRDLVSGAEP
jgi:RNA polymerase sigma factor for flagellar operon FliA